MRFLREPLLHFLVLGAGIYLAAGHFGPDASRYRIDAGPEQRARLADTYRQQYGAPPTPEQLQQVVDEYVRNEILYREGLAMGLAENDEIVRRRVVQKIEFVNEDLDTRPAADSDSVRAFFEKHREQYDVESTAAFEHIFFSSDRGGSEAARVRALRVLRSLNFERQTSVSEGDVFNSGNRFNSLSRTGANGLFGDSELSAALFTGRPNEWIGPVSSAYGWHLVRILSRQPARRAELAEVRERVEADYLADQRERANGLAFRRIASKYLVLTGGPRA